MKRFKRKERFGAISPRLGLHKLFPSLISDGKFILFQRVKPKLDLEVAQCDCY